jgi:hypothetical protein
MASNKFVAVQPIDVGTARGYNPGDPITQDVADSLGLTLGEQYAREGTKAAEEAVAAPSESPQQNTTVPPAK